MRGWKRYELTNHLGNVLAVVSDKHLSQDVDANNKVDFYFAEIISAQDYWPFGSVIADRQFVANGAGEYRYGFNGMEESGELGSGHYTTEFRELDSQTGRWWGVDPVRRNNISPYAVMSNSPTIMVDPNGADDYYSKTGIFLGV